MSDNFVTEKECTLKKANYEAALNRLDKRVGIVESNTAEIHKLSLSIERLTITVENMVLEQTAQRSKIEGIEGKDGKKWNQLTGYIISAIVGMIVGLIFNKFGM